MHKPSLVKIHWCFLKLSSGNENMRVSRADNSIKIWRNLPISNPKPDLHNINAHTKFGENPLVFTKLLSGNEIQMDGCTTDRWTHTETIIPRHTIVAGYKNGNYSVQNYVQKINNLFYSSFFVVVAVFKSTFSFFFNGCRFLWRQVFNSSIC